MYIKKKSISIYLSISISISINHVSVEADVVEIPLVRGNLPRVLLRGVALREDFRLAEGGVVVEGNLGERTYTVRTQERPVVPTPILDANSVHRQNQTHAATHNICGPCVPRRQCPVVALSLHLKRESQGHRSKLTNNGSLYITLYRGQPHIKSMIGYIRTNTSGWRRAALSSNATG